MTRQRPYTTLPRRAHLGIEVSSGAVTQAGLRVVGVAASSTAERAGIVPGDVVVNIDERSVDNVAQLVACVGRLVSGERLRITVLRNGDTLELSASISALATESPLVCLDHVVGPSDTWLRCIHTTPATPGPHPAIFYLQGSDWGSCEHPLTPAHPVRQMIAQFTHAGFATLRLERSGIGDSEGPACTDVDFEAELAGYQAGLAQLRDRHPSVFLFGHSLGGMVAPKLDLAGVVGVIVIGTSADTWHECLLGSFRRQAERAGQPAKVIARDLALLTELQEHVLREGKTPAEVYRLHPHLRDAAFTQFSGEQSFERTVRFFQQLEAAQLRAAWARVSCPVLALHGDEDWICTAGDADAIAALAGALGTAVGLPDVDHGLGNPGAAAAVVRACMTWMKDLPSGDHAPNPR